MKCQKEHAEGFPPIMGSCPKVLILGTFPGEESLRQKQYYAHPRNLFWEMMGQLCGASTDMNYDARLTVLRNTGIALWDVLNRVVGIKAIGLPRERVCNLIAEMNFMRKAEAAINMNYFVIHQNLSHTKSKETFIVPSHGIL